MLNTTSQLISYYRKIEEQQEKYHNMLAENHVDHSEVFKKLAKDSQRHIKMAQRAYQEGVTDAFEVGFLAKPLNPEDYTLNEPIGNLSESLKTMVNNEEKIIKFCFDASTNSSKLLPDVPETFERLVKRKKRNIEIMFTIK